MRSQSPHCEVGALWSCAVLVEKDLSPGMLKFEKERLSVKESQGQIMLKIQRVGGSTGKVKCRLKTKDVTAIGWISGTPGDTPFAGKTG